MPDVNIYRTRFGFLLRLQVRLALIAVLRHSHTDHTRAHQVLDCGMQRILQRLLNLLFDESRES